MIKTTVGKIRAALEAYGDNMPVACDFKGGGNFSIEPRDFVDPKTCESETCILLFNSNGGRCGHNVLNEQEYLDVSGEIINKFIMNSRYLDCHYLITTRYGDYRIYRETGNSNDGCYGDVIDPRIIQRMVDKGLLEYCGREASGLNGVRPTAKALVKVKLLS